MVINEPAKRIDVKTKYGFLVDLTELNVIQETCYSTGKKQNDTLKINKTFGKI